mmetsp:Transcript_22296/g.22468  ORF Transcript_22296/g.22468 Transcript_22296/m.22468 type:complete len:88 (+) Transcript_22296:27-290(+)
MTYFLFVLVACFFHNISVIYPFRLYRYNSPNTAHKAVIMDEHEHLPPESCSEDENNSKEIDNELKESTNPSEPLKMSKNQLRRKKKS